MELGDGNNQVAENDWVAWPENQNQDNIHDLNEGNEQADQELPDLNAVADMEEMVVDPVIHGPLP
jgi:hypothetical protein